jgi:signal transduction histidine kinase/DNA-binding response OmpR family regulator/CHASE3 domain sensor protein
MANPPLGTKQSASRVELRLVVGLGLAMAALLLAGAQMARSVYGYKDTMHWVVHSYQVLDALGEVLSGVREIESRQRSYIITGDPHYVAQRAREADAVRAVLARLERLTADNPTQGIRSSQIAQLTEARLQLLDKNVAVFQAQGFEAARDLIRSGVSERTMQALLKEVNLLTATEHGLLQQRTARAQSNSEWALSVSALLVGLTVIGMLLLWWRLRVDARNRVVDEASAQESDLLKQVLNLLPVGVFVADAQGALTHINPAARSIWVSDPLADPLQYGEYVGFWPESGKRLAPDDWALVRALHTGETIGDELVDIHCRDGSRKTIASYAMPIRNATGAVVSAIAVNIDVTSFKRTERQLRATAHFDETQSQALALFSTTFEREKILVGLLALLAQRHPFPVSALYGFEEASGRFRCETAHGMGLDGPRQFALGEGLLGQAAQTGRTAVLDCAELTLQTGLLDFAPMQVLMLPVSYQERRLAVLVLAASSRLDDGERAFVERLAVTLGVALDNMRQYSDLRLLTEQLRTRSEEIAVKNRQLEEASRMKSEFLANMSHELRTPLNAIIGFSEVLADGLLGELQPKQKEYANDITTSGTHLLSLINDILDLSKVEAGKMALELEPLQVEPLLQAGLQVVREQALAHGLHIEAAPPENLGEIWLDARKVKQILYNLLSNAVKFTPQGGTVGLSARRVGPEAVAQGTHAQYLEIAVSDTGIGILPADQARLFQPFTQIDSTLARRFQGTGLGLAMVKRLTELHGGQVSLHSAPGSGSTFTVWLPWRTQAEAEPALVLPPVVLAAQVPASVNALVRGGQPLALVVEDDDKSAELLRVQLEHTGFRAVRAVSAEAAMTLAEQECPDLITLDIHLPGMDGWEFLNKFKQHPQFSGVPVVIVSIVADKVLGLSLGASRVLQKPVGREELTQALAGIGFKLRSDGSKHTVLLVDDDPQSLQLLGTYLNPADFRVLMAFSGREGIDMAQREHPDLLVLDLMMPQVSGFDVVAALKADPHTANIPVIVVTAKQITAQDRAKLADDVNLLIEKSQLNHGRFIDEVKRAIAWKEH